MWLFTSRKARPGTSDRPRLRPCRPRLEVLEDRCLLSAGALDLAFGAGAGYVTTPLSSLSQNQDQATKVLVQPSGNIVVAGDTSIPITTTTTRKGNTTTTTTYVHALGVVTYNPDGSLDTAFGSGGIVRQLYAGNSASHSVPSAALEPTSMGDSKILLGSSDAAQGGMALLRLNADGTLDTTFGNGGQVITPIPTGSTSKGYNWERVLDITLTSGGQILALGVDTSNWTVLLARYNSNGTLDTTFGTGGTVTTALTATYGLGSRLALQPDGRIVVAGYEDVATPGGTMTEGLLLRYSGNGSLDSGFGNGGVGTTAPPLAASSGAAAMLQFRELAVYPSAGTANDGKIIAVGTASGAVTAGGPRETEWAVARYNADGSVDTTFGSGAGCLAISDPKFTSPDDYGSAVAIEFDGKPILVGSAGSQGAGPTYAQVARLNADGSMDATFGTGGLVTTLIGSYPSQVFNALALQADGTILAAGYVGANSHSFLLARYLPSAPKIGSFTASPNPVTSGSSLTLTASNITDANPGSTITQVAFYVQINGTNTLQGYGTQSAGVWTFTYTVNLTPGSYTLTAQSTDSYGVLGDPFALTLQVS
jgi:uncharacterized delta-60 repeat protein